MQNVQLSENCQQLCSNDANCYGINSLYSIINTVWIHNTYQKVNSIGESNRSTTKCVMPELTHSQLELLESIVIQERHRLYSKDLSSNQNSQDRHCCF